MGELLSCIFLPLIVDFTAGARWLNCQPEKTITRYITSICHPAAGNDLQ